MDEFEHDLSHGGPFGSHPGGSATGNDGSDGLTEFCHQQGVSEATVFAVDDAFVQLEQLLALRHKLPLETIKMIREKLQGTGSGLFTSGKLDAAREVEARCRRGFNLLLAYQDKQRPKPLRPVMGGMFTKAQVEERMLEVFQEAQMSTRAMALELGFTLAAGGDEPAKIARKFGYEKFTFCKCAEKFQKALDLPLRPGQRDESARANMTEAREKQLSAE